MRCFACKLVPLEVARLWKRRWAVATGKFRVGSARTAMRKDFCKRREHFKTPITRISGRIQAHVIQLINTVCYYFLLFLARGYIVKKSPDTKRVSTPSAVYWLIMFVIIFYYFSEGVNSLAASTGHWSHVGVVIGRNHRGLRPGRLRAAAIWEQVHVHAPGWRCQLVRLWHIILATRQLME